MIHRRRAQGSESASRRSGKLLCLVFAGFCLVALGGCGGPGRADIRGAVKKALANEANQFNSLAELFSGKKSPSFEVNIRRLKVISKKEDPDIADQWLILLYTEFEIKSGKEGEPASDQGRFQLVLWHNPVGKPRWKTSAFVRLE